MERLSHCSLWCTLRSGLFSGTAMIRPIVTAALTAVLAAGCLTERSTPPHGMSEIAVIPFPRK